MQKRQLSKFILLALFLPSFKAVALPMACRDLLDPERVKIQAASQTLTFVRALKESQITNDFTNTRKNLIGWQTFENLNQFKTRVQAFVDYYNSLPQHKKQIQRSELISALNADTELANFFNKLENFKRFKFLPTQYELRKRLVEEIINVLKLLPEELRPNIAKVAWDRRRLVVNTEAENLLKTTEAKFDEYLVQAGYKDYADFEKQIRAKRKAGYKKALAILDNNQIEIGTYVRESGRFWTPKVGFQNVYVAKTSAGGDLNNEVKRMRIEALGTGTDYKTYKETDDETKAKYGTLQVRPEAGVIRSGAFSWYGTDYYTFKISEIEKRVSLFFGDSYGISAFVDKPDFSMSAKSPMAKPTSWRGMFIPWSRRMMIVPFMAELLSTNNMFGSQNTDAKLPPEMQLGYDTGYEAQIFGRLDLDMVESFYFKMTPPTGEFLAELKKRNIKIYDSRVEPPVLYVEE